MKIAKIVVRGNEINFYPQRNKNGFYFEVENKGGFFTKDLCFYFGKPTLKNAVEIATNYIECLDFRIKIFDNFFKITTVKAV
jgi:hypothetical protein